jgi:hypothetical protein
VYAVNSDARAFQGPGKLPPSITTIVSTKTNPGIANLKVDTVIVVDVLRQLSQRPLFYIGLLAGLKAGGRLVVIDRKLPPVFPSSEQLTDSDLENELPAAGFAFQQQLTVLPYQYFLVFKR